MAKICIAFKIYNLPSSCIQHSQSFIVSNQIRLTVVSQTAANCPLSTEGKNPFIQKRFQPLRSSFQSSSSTGHFATMSDLIQREKKSTPT